MSRKQWQYHILLIALVGVQFVCPLFCAAIEQRYCNSMSVELQFEQTESGMSCCHKTKTDTTDESETPSESDTSCCVSDFNLVLPNETYNNDSTRALDGIPIVSIIPISAIQLVAQEHLLHIPPPPKLFISALNRTISQRGPPNIRS